MNFQEEFDKVSSTCSGPKCAYIGFHDSSIRLDGEFALNDLKAMVEIWEKIIKNEMDSGG